MNITLRALREMVSATIGMKLPTAKALRESGSEIIASAAIGEDGEISVYRNGFYTYKTPTGTTVYAVDRCAEYTYDSGDAVDASLFMDETWELGLALAGEDRLETNNNTREEKKHYSYSGDDIEQEDMYDPNDLIAAVDDSIVFDQMMVCLTEKQSQVIQLHFMDGLTQEEIQSRLGLSRGALLDRLNGAIKKLRENLK